MIPWLIWSLVASPVLDTPHYDYHPSVVESALYTCGQVGSGDAIYRNGVPVLTPGPGADSRHACSPSVIATPHPALRSWLRYLTGRTPAVAWLLYYECESLATDGHPSVCVALSADQQRWWRWTGAGFGATAAPLFTASSAYYGAGHPNAWVLPDGRIQLLYYDWDGVTAHHLAESYDGLHFWPVADWFLPHGAPGPGLRVHPLTTGGFLVLTVIDNQNVYTVGDGQRWYPFVPLGQASGQPSAPGRPGASVNRWGWLDPTRPLRLLTAEGATWPADAAIYPLSGRFR